MIIFTYDSWWRRVRDRPTFTAIINSTQVPSELKPKHYWMGFALYDDKVSDLRTKGVLYVGVIASHSDRKYLIKGPPKKPPRELPTERLNGG
jgi:hypothetical protein